MNACENIMVSQGKFNRRLAGKLGGSLPHIYTKDLGHLDPTTLHVEFELELTLCKP